MSVFASQFSRARPYADAYAGDGAGSRFRVPGAVTAGLVAGAGAALLVGATAEAAERLAASDGGDGGNGDGGDGGADAGSGAGAAGADPAVAGGLFDPAAMDDAALQLPGLVLDQPYPGHVGGEASLAALSDPAAAGSADLADAFPGLHTVSSLGEVGDISAAEAALLDDGSGSWSHSNEMLDTTVGGDGGDFSYVMAGDTVVTFGSDGGAVYG